MADEKMGSRRTRGVRRRKRGFTLVEVVMAASMLVLALMSLSAASLSLHQLRRANRERMVALNSIRSASERVHSLARAQIGQPGAWAQRVVDAVSPVGALQTGFDVPELTPLPGNAQAGSIRIVTNEQLTDADLGVQLGMPRDLDGNGTATSADVLATAQLLPVIVEVRWRGFRGERRIVHPFFVVGY